MQRRRQYEKFHQLILALHRYRWYGCRQPLQLDLIQPWALFFQFIILIKCAQFLFATAQNFWCRHFRIYDRSNTIWRGAWGNALIRCINLLSSFLLIVSLESQRFWKFNFQHRCDRCWNIFKHCRQIPLLCMNFPSPPHLSPCLKIS